MPELEGWWKRWFALEPVRVGRFGWRVPNSARSHANQQKYPEGDDIECLLAKDEDEQGLVGKNVEP